MLDFVECCCGDLLAHVRDYGCLLRFKAVRDNTKQFVLNGSKGDDWEEELFMKLKGWQFVQLEKLPIAEQMQLFAEAKYIISPHGAGLTNLLWSQPGPKVIEFQRGSMLSKKVYPILAHHLELDFHTFCPNIMVLPLLANRRKPKGVKRLNDLFNFTTNWGSLKKMMRMAGMSE